MKSKNLHPLDFVFVGVICARYYQSPQCGPHQTHDAIRVYKQSPPCSLITDIARLQSTLIQYRQYVIK